MMVEDGRVPEAPGSREPSPTVSALSGFDPSRWRPMDTAPKDQPILVSYDHDADPYQDPANPGKLTAYACHAEGGDFLSGRGVAIARWSEGWFESEGWEHPAGDYWMPAVWSAWFNGDYADHVVNPVAWMPLPAIAMEARKGGDGTAPSPDDSAAIAQPPSSN